jgi:SAM-dependent methyltransferase
VDDETLRAYDRDAAGFAADWHSQPPATDLQTAVLRFFRRGATADIGCGSGREVAFLNGAGFEAVGFDASAGLIEEARRRYPQYSFRTAELPGLAGLGTGIYDNVLCETVIMHLERDAIGPAVRRLVSLLRPGGTLYLTWRITEGTDRRDEHGRLYSAFDAALVRDGLAGTTILVDEARTSASSGKAIHRIVARRPTETA